jgi:hypothetical protein
VSTTTRRVADEAPPSKPSQKSTPSAEPDVARFGETWTYKDGLRVAIGKLEPFKPSEFASFRKGDKKFVKFHVVIGNRTNKRFDPNLFSTTAATGDREAEEVFDSSKDLNGSPSTVILPGHTKKFWIGYGVDKGKDLVLEVSPDFDHEKAVFIS